MSGEKNHPSLQSPTVSHNEDSKHLKIHGEGSSSASEDPYEEHGAGIDHKVPQELNIQASPDLWWSRTRHRLREPLSEFFGVFILILFGDG